MFRLMLTGQICAAVTGLILVLVAYLCRSRPTPLAGNLALQAYQAAGPAAAVKVWELEEKLRSLEVWELRLRFEAEEQSRTRILQVQREAAIDARVDDLREREQAFARRAVELVDLRDGAIRAMAQRADADHDAARANTVHVDEAEVAPYYVELGGIPQAPTEVPWDQTFTGIWAQVEVPDEEEAPALPEPTVPVEPVDDVDVHGDQVIALLDAAGWDNVNGSAITEAIVSGNPDGGPGRGAPTVPTTPASPRTLAMREAVQRAQQAREDELLRRSPVTV